GRKPSRPWTDPWPWRARTSAVGVPGALNESPAAGSGLDDGVVQGPESGDLHPDAVATLQEHRRLSRESDAGRGAGDHHVAGQERHLRRQKRDEVVDVEDEVLRIAVLKLGPVHPGAELEGVGI